MGIAAVAMAAPPPGHGAMLARNAARTESPGLSRLDLRAPLNFKSRAATVDASAFPTFRRANTERANDDVMRPRLEDAFRSLGDDAPAMRPMSRPEQLARRFHREGLPVARLFESRSALVSLGLNQRGKPGIWLIQKIP